MKKLVAIAASVALMTGVSVSALAAEKSAEDMCKEKATKEKIAADKMDAFMKTCMKKHEKHEKSEPKM